MKTGGAAPVSATWSFPRHDGPALDAGPTVEPAGRAIRFLAEHRRVFRIADPAAELHPVRTRDDEMSMTHVRFEQHERGVRVVGGDVAVHYDREGHVTSVQERYVPNLAGLSLAPRISAEEARAAALGAESRGRAAEEPRLVVFAAREDKPALAWEVPVRGAHRGSWLVTVDAETATVLDTMDRSETLLGSGLGLDGTRREVQYVVSSGTNVLADMSQAAAIVTFDMHGTYEGTQVTNVTSSDPTSWDTSSELGPGAAVDAQRLVAVSSDFFRTTFGHEGWDGRAGRMNVYVHVGDEDGNPGYDNAFYEPTGDIIAFGDGRTLFRPLAGHLDIVAHEFTHAVTAHQSDLRYQGQSGALSEAVSDVFAVFVEHANAPHPTNNWVVGEGLLRETNQPLRDLSAPENGYSSQPSHMSHFVKTRQDNGGVHVNSGIPSHAAYLMTMGGVHAVSKVSVDHGIGFESAAKVWYRANAEYLGPSSDFAAAAQATLEAAADLALSSADRDAIECAWKAVGVLPGACLTTAPAPAKTAPAAPEPAPTLPATSTAPSPARAPGPTDTPPADSAEPPANGAVPPAASAEPTPTAPVPAATELSHEDGAPAAGCSATPGRASDTRLAFTLLGLVALLAERRKKSGVPHASICAMSSERQSRHLRRRPRDRGPETRTRT